MKHNYNKDDRNFPFSNPSSPYDFSPFDSRYVTKPKRPIPIMQKTKERIIFFFWIFIDRNPPWPKIKASNNGEVSDIANIYSIITSPRSKDNKSKEGNHKPNSKTPYTRRNNSNVLSVGKAKEFATHTKINKYFNIGKYEKIVFW